MTLFHFSGIRLRLITLVLLALIPILGLVVYTGLEQRSLARGEAFNNALRLIHQVSQLQMQMIDDARQILFVLSQMPQVRRRDSATCSAIFANLIRKSKGFMGLIATDPNGNVFAGMGKYEHRSWPAWHLHMIYVFLALHFLFRLRLGFKKNSSNDAPSGPQAGCRRPPSPFADLTGSNRNCQVSYAP